MRFQLTPTPSFFEELARRRYRRHENKLVRQERWGLPEGGLSSTLNRAEMHNAQRTQNRSLFWLEVVVAADRAQDCKTLAAAVQARRGENRLHRRWMHVRQNLYRRRFPHALGPPLPSLRSLVSAAEAAHLLALPSARMKGVPVRRLTLPRIPAPPEAMRATDLDARPRPSRRAPPPRAMPATARELMTVAHRRLPYRALPVLRAENAEVLIHPDDRKFGALLVGSMGSGKCIGPDDLVLLAGRLLPAEQAWDHYGSTAVYDGTGWWSEPLEHPLTCALDDHGRIVTAPVIRLYRQRVRERLRRIRLSDGSELTITARHRLRGPDDWISDLRVGGVVCVPRRLSWPGKRLDLELVEVLAWQISEGCETTGAKRSRRGSSSLAISQGDVSVLERLRELYVSVADRYGLRMSPPRIDHERAAPTLVIQLGRLARLSQAARLPLGPEKP